MGENVSRPEQQRPRQGKAVSVQDWSTTTKRIEWLLVTQFNGNKTSMVKALGLTTMVISRVVSGQRPPGSRLLRSIIERLSVSADWLLHGRGEPLPGTAAGSGTAGRTPVLKTLLPGRLTGGPSQEPLRWLDSTQLLSPTQYWFFLASGHPLLAVYQRGFVGGDLLLLETDPTRFPPEEKYFERLCVVKNPRGEEPPVKLGLVYYHPGAEEEGPARLEVDTLDRSAEGLGVVEEFIFRRYPGGEVKASQRKLTLTQERVISEPRLPVIKYGDIVAVWTGVLLRYGYVRLA